MATEAEILAALLEQQRGNRDLSVQAQQREQRGPQRAGVASGSSGNLPRGFLSVLLDKADPETIRQVLQGTKRGEVGGGARPSDFEDFTRGFGSTGGLPDTRAEDLQLALLEEQLSQVRSQGGGPSSAGISGGRGGSGPRLSSGLTAKFPSAGPSGGSSLRIDSGGIRPTPSAPRRRARRKRSSQERLVRGELDLRNRQLDAEIEAARKQREADDLNERLGRENKKFIRGLLSRILG